MRAHPGHRDQRQEKAAPREASPATKAARRRLSFKDKHALETLPGTMSELQTKIHGLQEKLHDPDLYARDRKAFDAASAALTETQAALAAAEEKWLELEILREELEG